MNTNQYFDDEQSQSNLHSLQHQVKEYEAMQASGEIRFWDIDNLLDIIDFYDEAMRTEDALEVTKLAIAQHPFDPMPYIRQAHFLLELNQLEEAHEALDKAALYDPKHEEILLFRAEIFIREQDYDAAIDLLTELRQRDDITNEDLFNISLVEAFMWESRKEYELAFDNLYMAYAQDPRAEVTSIRLRIIMENMQDLMPTIPLFQKITDKDPYAASAWLLLAYAYAREDMKEEAMDAYEYAIVAQDNYEYAYYEYVDFLFTNKLYAKAREILLEASQLEVFTNDAFPLMRLGECWQEEENYEKALEYYQKALEFDHLEGYVYFLIGNLNLAHEYYAAAASAYESAHNVSKEQAHYLLALAKAKAKMQKDIEATNHFIDAIKLQSTNTDFWGAYLAFLIDLKAYDAADQLCIMMEKYDLNISFTQYALASVKFIRGHYTAGFEQLYLALETNSYAYDILFSLAPELEDNPAIMNYINDYLETLMHS